MYRNYDVKGIGRTPECVQPGAQKYSTGVATYFSKLASDWFTNVIVIQHYHKSMDFDQEICSKQRAVGNSHTYTHTAKECTNRKLKIPTSSLMYLGKQVAVRLQSNRSGCVCLTVIPRKSVLLRWPLRVFKMEVLL